MPEGILAGTPAYWRVDGGGSRKTFLLHCTMAHSGAWKGVITRLSDICDMVAMDLPAHGRSGAWDRSTTWQTQSTGMAVELLEKIGAPADLIGHSFGATVALRIAVERPDLVRSLTLIDPVFFSAAKDAGRQEFTDHMNLHHDFHDLLEAKDYRGAAKKFSEMWEGGIPWDDLPEGVRTYQEERIMMIPAGGESLLGEGPDYIPLSRLAAITVPVLLIEGEKTDPVISAVQETLDRVLPDSQRVVIKGAGHMVPISHSGKTAEAIRGFFSR